MHYKKLEFKIPVFFGCLGSLVFCALLAIGWPAPVQGVDAEDAAVSLEAAEDIPPAAVYSQFFTEARPQGPERILELYRQSETQGYVVEFFTGVCPSKEITKAILFHADMFNIAPALAFALGWEESRLDPAAVNDRNRDGSIDRGIFQLNNRSFPRLDVQAFFNPELNAYYGMSHLRYCLDAGGTEIAALAMYNAGTGRVRNTGTPKTTLDYVSRILENRREIENRFLEWEGRNMPQLNEYAEIAEAEPERRNIIPLMPLGIR